MTPGNTEAAHLTVQASVQQWHLGFRTVENLPVSRGYDTFFGLLAGGADHYTKALEACGGDGVNCSCGNITSDKLPFRIDFYDAPNGAPGGPATQIWDATTYDAYAYSARAASLVANHDTSSPFFLYWAPHKVHSPLQVDLPFLEHYPPDPGRVCTDTPETCSGRGYGTSGPSWRGTMPNPHGLAGCGCETMCYCNRRIIKGMVSVVDSMLTNLTVALTAKDMWKNT